MLIDKPFSSDADIERARQIAERFSTSGVPVRTVGKEVVESLDIGGLSESTYEKLARLCSNRYVDMRLNVKSARELSNYLFGYVIEPASK